MKRIQGATSWIAQGPNKRFGWRSTLSGLRLARDFIRVAFNRRAPAATTDHQFNGFWSRSAFFLLLASISYGLPVVSLQAGATVLGYGMLALVVSVPTWVLVRRSLAEYLLYWTILASTQNVFSGLWAQEGQTVSVAVTEAKTLSSLIALVAMSAALVRYLRRHWAITIGVSAYGLLLIVNATEVALGTTAYLRNFAWPLAVLLLVVAHPNRADPGCLERCLRWTLSFLSVYLVLGSLLEVLIGTASWRRGIGFNWLDALQSLSVQTRVLGIEVPRVAGFLGEPVIAGYMAAGVAVSAVVAHRAKRVFSRRELVAIVVATAVTTVAAGTKNSVLIVACCAALILALQFLKAPPSSLMAISLTITVGVTVSYIALIAGTSAVTRILDDGVYFVPGDSTSIHLEGLVEGFRSGLFQPFGHGLGDGGNFVNNFAGGAEKVPLHERVVSGAESGLGVMAHQIGVLGVLAFLGVIVTVGRMAGTYTALLLAVWLSAALFSESTLGPLIAAVFVIPAGLIAQVSTTSTDLNSMGGGPITSGPISTLS